MAFRVALVTPFSWAQPHDVNEHVAGLAAELRGRGHRVTVRAPGFRGFSTEGWTFGARPLARVEEGSEVELRLEPTDPQRLHVVLRHPALRRTGRVLDPTGKLDVPKNITPIFLPSRAPELNPVENVWQYLRQNWLSNTVFENYDAIVDAACAAWRNLIAQPETITSIGMRDWAHVGQPL